MADNLLQRFAELVEEGGKLVPLGGFDFSGYNARLQTRYLEWRKSCLELLEQVGPIGFPYKSKILGDSNGGYFYQASAHLILTNVRELHEKLKASPELATASPPVTAGQPSTPAAAATTTVSPSGGRVIKPPPKPTPQPAATAPPDGSAPAAAAPSEVSNKVYVIGEPADPLRQQLSMFLDEVGIEEIAIDRVHGTMLSLEELEDRKDVRYAFFVFNSDDVSYAMFELGHFVGKLGKGRVTVLHMSDVDFPKNVPGVSVNSIVVKLEEATLSILKELKSAGVKVSL